MSKYWAERQAKAQETLTNKSIRETEKQLVKYYSKSMKKIIGQFELIYNKIFSKLEKGEEITPADLYKLDSYWELQAQLRDELQKLGDKQTVLLSDRFEAQFFDIYNSIAIPSATAFNKIDKAGARQMINQIWCADGKSWSSRVWVNTDKLQQALNDNLINCVVAGKKPSQLKRILQEQFNVSYRRADTLVRTEMAHIQTLSAKQRYQDYGLERYEILGNEDDSCGNHSGKDCHELNGKKFLYSEMSIGVNAPPFHPNCRCCIIPVIE